MSYNKNEIKTRSTAKGKQNPFKKDVIVTSRGQWDYPGQVTKIPSNNITMAGVPYPVIGVDDTGATQLMMPGQDYKFPGTSVTEYPLMAAGGVVDVPIDTLVPTQNLAKKDKKLVQDIKQSISQGKHIDPLDVRTGITGIDIKDGHHRYLAYKEAGVNTVPVKFQSGGSKPTKMGRDQIMDVIESGYINGWPVSRRQMEFFLRQAGLYIDDHGNFMDNATGELVRGELPPDVELQDDVIAAPDWEPGEYFDEEDDPEYMYYKKGGSKRRRRRKGLRGATDKNIKSSVNFLMRRNELLFGPGGRRLYLPRHQQGGQWLDQYKEDRAYSPNTLLTPGEEQAFNRWFGSVNTQGLWDPDNVEYDYRGAWKSMQGWTSEQRAEVEEYLRNAEEPHFWTNDGTGRWLKKKPAMLRDWFDKGKIESTRAGVTGDLLYDPTSVVRTDSTGRVVVRPENWLDEYKTGGSKNWMKDIKSTGQCTGENFGGPRCRPGTREYAFAKRARSGEFSKQDGGLTPIDSLRHQAAKTMKYEQLMGSASGTGLPNFGNPALPVGATEQDAVEWYMQNIAPQLDPYTSAMEKGEAGDFIYNTGKDPRGYAIQEYYRKYDPSKLDKSGNWPGRKGSDFDAEYKSTVGTLSENERRVLMNKGRDWYYQNINKINGKVNPAYHNTWFGRIWNTNDFSEFDPNNPKFTPKKKEGGWIDNY